MDAPPLGKVRPLADLNFVWEHGLARTTLMDALEQADLMVVAIQETGRLVEQEPAC
ncbi:MAG: hypothetical protein ACYCW6_03700 [Candidatus Xenobia bacterium]